jgi:hypothetical protein
MNWIENNFNPYRQTLRSCASDAPRYLNGEPSKVRETLDFVYAESYLKFTLLRPMYLSQAGLSGN